MGHELREVPGQVGSVLGFAEESATGSVNEFGEHADARLHDGDAACQRFEHVEALRRPVGRRDGKNVESSQEGDLLVSVDFTDVLEVVAETGGLSDLLHLGQKGLVFRTEPSGDPQPNARCFLCRLFAQPRDGFGESSQPLLGCDPGEIPDDEFVEVAGLAL